MRNKLSPSTDMSPFRQGDLDGLCGIYVIINCVRFLCPEANSKFLEKLFRVLVQSLEREVDKPLAVLWRGIEQPALLAVMRRVSQDGMTMIVVTHELRFAQRCAHRVLFMESGRIVADMKTAEFFAHPPSERIATYIADFRHDIIKAVS